MDEVHFAALSIGTTRLRYSGGSEIFEGTDQVLTTNLIKKFKFGNFQPQFLNYQSLMLSPRNFTINNNKQVPHIHQKAIEEYSAKRGLSPQNHEN